MKTEKKLFGNVGGNQFRLLTEGIAVKNNKPEGSDLVREGLKKVFSNGGRTISYKSMANVGLGYIKDVTEATKCALQEAKEIAEEFGYQANDSTQKFVKEMFKPDYLGKYGNKNDFSKLDAQNPSHADAKMGSNEIGHEEGNMENSEEKEEVKLAKKIMLCTSLLKKYLKGKVDVESGSGTGASIRTIEECASKLIQMHGGQ